MHENNRHIALYFTGIFKKIKVSLLPPRLWYPFTLRVQKALRTWIFCFYVKKKLSTEFLEAGIIAGWHDIQISIKTHVLQLQNFVILKAANNGKLKSVVISCQQRDGMQWQKIWPASRQENGFFEVWPVGLIFSIFTNGGCTCFYEEKKKIIAHATQLFAVCPETWVALDTANSVTFFPEVWQKFTKFSLVQPGP